jgi:hypothetical protein
VKQATAACSVEDRMFLACDDYRGYWREIVTSDQNMALASLRRNVAFLFLQPLTGCPDLIKLWPFCGPFTGCPELNSD